MGREDDSLVQQVSDLHDQISNLKTLEPSENVNTLFTKLVRTCLPPTPIDVTKLGKNVDAMRSSLINLCGRAEGLLESHYAAVLASHDRPLHHLATFPYYTNYLKLSLLEHTLLMQQNDHNAPHLVAFLGSGPLPLTSIVLARDHLTATTFHNYDIDAKANALAEKLVSSCPDLSKRMSFITSDVFDVTTTLGDYDVVFLAALVGMDKEVKVRVVDHLAKYMSPGALLVVRSAHGARAFLYPVVDPCDLRGFEVLSVYHPSDDVVNSVVVARKYPLPVHALDQGLILPNKCSEIQSFNPLINHGNMNMIEELAFEETL